MFMRLLELVFAGSTAILRFVFGLVGACSSLSGVIAVVGVDPYCFSCGGGVTVVGIGAGVFRRRLGVVCTIFHSLIQVVYILNH